MATITEAATEVDYVVTALPNTSIVDSVLNSDGGVFQSASANTMICDTSTISPIGAKEFGKAAREVGMMYCDTPMSGGIMGA